MCLVRKDRQAVHILLSHSISIMDRQRGDGEAFSSPLEDQVGEREREQYFCPFDVQ